ncbi:MAG: to ribosomal protein, partial [Planctomycetota bacterium]
MHGKQLVKKFAMDLDQLDQLIGQALGQTTEEQLADAMGSTVGDVAPNAIVKGKIIRILEDGTVFVDAGYKSEGRIPLDEFENPEAVHPGMEVECLVEAIDDEDGYIELSKRKADRIRGWEKIIETHSEGDVVEGEIVKKIKGGLLVEIGVPVFLPASQVDIRRVGDIGEWIGQHVRARIIKIDEERMNIVVSRRKLIEEEREKL